jgi:hypothetical protein
VKGQFEDRFDESFGDSVSERSGERLICECLGEKTKYATRMLSSVAASES